MEIQAYLGQAPESNMKRYLQKVLAPYPPENVTLMYCNEVSCGFDIPDYDTPEGAELREKNQYMLCLAHLFPRRDGTFTVSFCDGDDWDMYFDFGTDEENARKFLEEIREWSEIPMSALEIFQLCKPYGGICEWGDLENPPKKEKRKKYKIKG